MSSPRVIGLAALLLLGAASAAIAQDGRPMTAPSGQGASGPGDARPAPGDLPPEDRRGREPPPEDDASRSAARSDPSDDRDEGLDRARDAARRADPRLLGLERARDAARKADPNGTDCLSAREARGAISAKRAVTLSQALRTARDAWDGEVIDYKLCTFDGALAYDLTLLNTEGRVARVRVEASSGKLVGVR